MPASGVLVAPAGLGEHEDRLAELLDGHRAVERVGSRGGVDDLELRHGGADVEPLVVDRQRHEPGFETTGADGVRELAGVLADDADGDLRMALREVLDQPGQQQVMGGAERPQRGGAAGQRSRSPNDLGRLARRRQRALGLGLEQPTRVGELQAAAGTTKSVTPSSASSRATCSETLGRARCRASAAAVNEPCWAAARK